MLRDLGQAAEDLGFDSLWVRDHLIVSPHEMEQFQQGYLVDGRRVVSGDYLGCVPALAALAAATTRPLLGTCILNFPRRHPVDIANELATVDQISGGRLILQGATGHPMRDFAPLGLDVPPRLRGQMMEEEIEIIRALWSSEEPLDFEGEHYTLTQARIGSRPVQQLPPIWLGIDKTYKRVARCADGFTLTGSMFGGDLEHYRDAVAEIKREAVAVGRDPAAITAAARFAIVVDEDRARAKDRAEQEWGALWRRSDAWHRDWAGTPDDIAAAIVPFLEAGAEHVLLWPVAHVTAAQTMADLELFAREVIPRLRAFDKTRDRS
jgi:alkanesulfonate monooxygenase SsuD/methylene tetrahydromethanopterin reductase-like flavin-dependent oxidoreductase (luciferase family)